VRGAAKKEKKTISGLKYPAGGSNGGLLYIFFNYLGHIS